MLQAGGLLGMGVDWARHVVRWYWELWCRRARNRGPKPAWSSGVAVRGAGELLRTRPAEGWQFAVCTEVRGWVGDVKRGVWLERRCVRCLTGLRQIGFKTNVVSMYGTHCMNISISLLETDLAIACYWLQGQPVSRRSGNGGSLLWAALAFSTPPELARKGKEAVNSYPKRAYGTVPLPL